MFYNTTKMDPMSRPIFSAVYSICIVVVMLFFGGCATTKVVPNLQSPPMPTLDLSKFIAPETHLKRFVPEGGAGSITKDNVTVKVADITDKITDNRFSTEIEGPNGNKHPVSVSPMMLVLEIENGTDHIITLRRTIIIIEDENQQEYPLINSLPESKAKLITRVSEAFDKYLENVSEKYKKTVYGEYAEKYKNFSHELKTAAKMSFGDSLGNAVVAGLIGGGTSNIAQVRTSDMKEGKVLTEHGINSKIEEKSPDNLYMQGHSHLQREILTIKEEIKRLKGKE